jgi:fibro-slime domain-containing protein
MVMRIRSASPWFVWLCAVFGAGNATLGCSSGGDDASSFSSSGHSGSTESTSSQQHDGAGGSGPTNTVGSGGQATIHVGELGGSETGGQGGEETGHLTAVIRDFKFYDANDPSTNPDFENVPTVDASGAALRAGYGGPWDDHDIVAETLGADQTPDYLNATGSSWTTHGAEAFHAWFHDVDGTNVRVEYPITLADDGKGNYGYDSQQSGTPLSAGGRTTKKMFFPIDDGTNYATPFGNQGQDHNYSFTVEIHTVFTYHGKETFHFRGDDDVFVYINGKLAINLGGIHQAETADVNIDTLGLTVGQKYPLDFFYAERHVTESNLLITTTLELVTVPVAR